MKIPKPHKLCVGCKACVLLNYRPPTNRRYYPVYECRFTPDRIKRIPRCPCSYCLVKIMCVNLCDKLQKKCDAYSDVLYYDLPKRGEAK